MVREVPEGGSGPGGKPARRRNPRSTLRRRPRAGGGKGEALHRSAPPLTPWVAAVVRNLVVDLVRRRKVRRADSLETLLAEERIEVPDGGDSPLARAERRELQDRVARAVRDLPPAFREVVVLRDYQDLSYEEIAGVLGIPRGTVMSRLLRARCLLRTALSAIPPREGGEA